MEQEETTPMGRGSRARRRRKFFEDTLGDRRESVGSRNGDIQPESGASGQGEEINVEVKEEVVSEAVVKVEEGVKMEQETQTEQVGDTFDTEWEERVRLTVFCPGYLPQPAPVGSVAANWEEHSRLLLGGRGDHLTAK